MIDACVLACKAVSPNRYKLIGPTVRDTSDMVRPRGRGGVVADNLARLIGEQSVNSWAKAHQLDQPTVRRILIGEMSPTEQTISKIASAIGLAAWQLLVPEIDPKDPPVLREANGAERALYERIRADLAELQKLRGT